MRASDVVAVIHIRSVGDCAQGSLTSRYDACHGAVGTDAGSVHSVKMARTKPIARARRARPRQGDGSFAAEIGANEQS
jgi:hypothetical protein